MMSMNASRYSAKLVKETRRFGTYSRIDITCVSFYGFIDPLTCLLMVLSPSLEFP